MSSENQSEDLSSKRVFTTGEAAAVCKVSQQTIIRCFDSGRLTGFRVPGSRFRRIPREELMRFMRANNIPLDVLGSGRKKVLVVDDDPRIVELYVDLLSRDGRFELKTAGTGYDAGLLTQSFRPDLIILDYMLPDINGTVVCKRLRENPDLRDIKVLCISGVIKPGDVQTLLDAGANAFMQKPFHVNELTARIAELLELGAAAAAGGEGPHGAGGSNGTSS